MVGIRGKQEDHLELFTLHEIEYDDDTKSLTFYNSAKREFVSLEKLKEFYELLGKTIKNGEDYKDFKEWHDEKAERERKQAFSKAKRT